MIKSSRSGFDNKQSNCEALMHFTLIRLMTGIIAVFLAGCTSQGWYEGFRIQQQRECNRYPQQYEVQRCLEKMNNMTYDEYRQQRDKITSR